MNTLSPSDDALAAGESSANGNPSLNETESLLAERVLAAPGKEEALAPTPPAKVVAEKRTRQRSKLLPVLLILFALIVLVAGGLVGGFFYKRGQEAAFFQAGETALAAGEWAAARDAYDQALAVEPVQARVLTPAVITGRGIALFHLGEQEAALADLDTALALDPSLVEQRACRALIWFEQGKPELALPESDRVLASDGLDTALQSALRRKRLDYFFTVQTDFDASLAEGEKLLALDATAGLPYALRAWRYYQMLELDQALENANTALRYDPNLELALRVRGSLSAFRYDVKASLADLNQAVRLDGNDFHALAMRSFVHLLNEDLAAAQADLQQAAGLSEKAPVVLWAQAFEKLYTYDESAAAVLAEQALKSGARAEYLWVRGLAYTRTADRQKRIDCFNRALDLQGDFAPALLSLGYDRLQVHDTDNLEEDVQPLITWMPASSSPHVFLALFYDRQGAYEQAQAELALALELEPNHSQLAILQGRSESAKALYAKAVVRFQAALAQRENSLAALDGLGRVYLAQKEYTLAREQAGLMLAIDSDDIGGRVLLADIALAEGKIAGAIQQLDEAAAIDPNQPGVLLARSRAYLQKKDPVKGLVDATRLIEWEPKNAEAYALAGRLYVLQENYDQARTHADKALKLDAKNANAHLVYLLIAANQDEWEEVVSYGKKMLHHGIVHVLLYESLSLAYYEQEEYDQALEYGNLALEIDATLEKVNNQLANIYWHRGDIEQAIEYVKLVIRHSKDSKLRESAQKDQATLKKIPPLVDGKRTIGSSGLPFSMTYDNDKWVQVSDYSGSSYWDFTLTSNETWGMDADLEIHLEEAYANSTVQKEIKFYERFMQLIFGSAYQVLNTESYRFPDGNAVMRTVELAGSGGRYRGKEYYLLARGYLIRVEFYADPADFNKVNAEVEKLISTISINP